jgi:hypothetical protein
MPLMSSDPELQEVVNPIDIRAVCDRHPMATAYTRFSKVVQISGAPKLVELLFCKNCADKYEMTLIPNGWVMKDERDRLNR